MITIEITNNICTLFGPKKETMKVYESMKVRNPNAYHLRGYMPRGWDGKIDYVKDNGKFDTGLLARVVAKCESLGFKVKLEDSRHYDVLESDKARVRKKLSGDLRLRDDQMESVQALVNNKIKGIPHPRGMLKVATHGGKTFISCGIYNAYRAPTIFVMNSKELFMDAIRDIPKMLDCSVGYVGNGKIVMGKFMICMVKSLQNKLKDPKIKEFLANCQIGIWDEGDMAGNKTNKSVIKCLYNTIVRVALSGTINASPLKKDLVKNLTIESIFGEQIFQITNRQLIDKGISSEVKVNFLEGNEEDFPQSIPYPEQIDEGIIKNKKRNRRIIERIQTKWDEGKRYQLIICQRHKHIQRVFKRLTKLLDQGLIDDATIDWVHHSRKDRFKVTQDFMDGKINILIGSMILKRGKNFKKMSYMLNAGGGKSPENILQLLGRAFRGCEDYEDMYDQGFYLKKHSRKRVIYYKNEKLQVTNKYK